MTYRAWHHSLLPCSTACWQRLKRCSQEDEQQKSAALTCTQIRKVNQTSTELPEKQNCPTFACTPMMMVQKFCSNESHACRCNREERHRGLCNRRATIPGVASYPEPEVQRTAIAMGMPVGSLSLGEPSYTAINTQPLLICWSTIY